MPLHFDADVLKADLTDLLNACKAGLAGTENHRTFANHLTDPNHHVRKAAKFGIVANCANCMVEISCRAQTIWERGWPVSISLEDHTCPACKSTQGFHYSRVESFHA
ncbi:MAG TPA: hypothetical protein VF069_06715 [Streptosporangiaceae bacterium]